MADIKLPPDMYRMLMGWYSKLPSITANQLMCSLAINDYNEKLKKLSKDELEKLDSHNVKLCQSWIEKGILPQNTRGYKGYGRIR